MLSDRLKDHSEDGNVSAPHELHFSEEFGISHLTLRDDAFTVTDGDVTSARRSGACAWRGSHQRNRGLHRTRLLRDLVDRLYSHVSVLCRFCQLIILTLCPGIDIVSSLRAWFISCQHPDRHQHL